VATIFALAGIESPEGLHGRSLVTLLDNPAVDWPYPSMYEHTGHDFGGDIARQLRENPLGAVYQNVPWYTVVFDDGWKYIRYLMPGVAEELYDLGSDPDELKNLAGEREHGRRLARLRESLLLELKRTGAPGAMQGG
jgi:arylsulfatase A-like enzyme